MIGAGPAGLMAAEVLAQGGARVTLYDRMPSVARKFLLAGRGGLNLTHSEELPRFLARYGAAKKRKLLADAGIVRNRAKIEASVVNAKGVLALQEEYGSFSRYLWQFVDGKPLQPRRAALRDVPARTEISDALSADLKRRGFKFVGTTIMYAFMQAVGMVNDHARDCFRYKALRG